MPKAVRVIHYINQFFGQVGGEEKANISPFVQNGPLGPGDLVRKNLGNRGEVVATIICGDNYFNDNVEEAKGEILKLISPYEPDLVLAGPAFNAGRYGIACGEVCRLTSEELGIRAVTGMNRENPGVEQFRRELYIVETGPSALGMAEALTKMVQLGLKLVDKEPLGRPEQEGFIPQGVKKNVISNDLGSTRAIRALLAKINEESFRTEIKRPAFDQVQPAPPIKDLSRATIALVTEGGMIAQGNPDQIESHRATRYGRYSLEGMTNLDAERFESIHRGYDTAFVNEFPDRLVPVDALREMEQAGTIGKLYPYFFTTTGVATSVENGKKIGRGIAEDLKESGVSGVILTST